MKSISSLTISGKKIGVLYSGTLPTSWVNIRDNSTHSINCQVKINSDGKCEMYFLSNITISGTSYTRVNLPISFKDVNYFVTVTTTTYQVSGASVVSRTINSFSLDSSETQETYNLCQCKVEGYVDLNNPAIQNLIEN